VFIVNIEANAAFKIIETVHDAIQLRTQRMHFTGLQQVEIGPRNNFRMRRLQIGVVSGRRRLQFSSLLVEFLIGAGSVLHRTIEEKKERLEQQVRDSKERGGLENAASHLCAIPRQREVARLLQQSERARQRVKETRKNGVIPKCCLFFTGGSALT
jgi:hypothetical protein